MLEKIFGARRRAATLKKVLEDLDRKILSEIFADLARAALPPELVQAGPLLYVYQTHEGLMVRIYERLDGKALIMIKAAVIDFIDRQLKSGR
jgi:hypothetical protein